MFVVINIPIDPRTESSQINPWDLLPELVVEPSYQNEKIVLGTCLVSGWLVIVQNV